MANCINCKKAARRDAFGQYNWCDECGVADSLSDVDRWYLIGFMTLRSFIEQGDHFIAKRRKAAYDLGVADRLEIEVE